MAISVNVQYNGGLLPDIILLTQCWDVDSGERFHVNSMSKYKRFIRLDFGTGLLERVGTGIVGTIGYVVLPTGVSTDVSRDIV